MDNLTKMIEAYDKLQLEDNNFYSRICPERIFLPLCKVS